MAPTDEWCNNPCPSLAPYLKFHSFQCNNNIHKLLPTDCDRKLLLEEAALAALRAFTSAGSAPIPGQLGGHGQPDR